MQRRQTAAARTRSFRKDMSAATTISGGMTFRRTLHQIIPCALATATLATATLAACAARPPASPERMAYCQKLYGLWWNFEQDPVFLHTGERAQAELALDDCQHGRYDEGIRTLKEILTHGGFQVGTL